MLDAALTSLESGVTMNNQKADFTPLSKGLRTITQTSEFKPPLVTETSSHEKPLIANLGIPPDQKQDDYINKLTAELTQMAQQQGLEPKEQITSANSLTEHPLKKMSISQRIKNLFKGIKSWFKREKVTPKS